MLPTVGEDLVAGREARDRGSHRLDHSSRVPPEHHWKDVRERGIEVALAQLVVDRVEPRTADADEHPVGADLGAGNVLELEAVVAAELVYGDGAHGLADPSDREPPRRAR